MADASVTERLDDSRLGQWWLSLDRPLLAAMLALLCAGAVVSLIASPAIAMKRGLETFHFVQRHMTFALIGSVILVATSFLTPHGVRRTALIVTALAIPALVLVLMFGPVLNGAQRWLVFGGWQLQPTEFLKPAVVVLFAWALAAQQLRPDMPALPLASGVVLGSLCLVAPQPDLGQTSLIAAVCLVLHFLAGRPLKELAALVTAAGIAAVGFYFTFSHMRSRLDRHIDPKSGDTHQIDRAIESFLQGGWTGRGPGEGVIKTRLPDAHTDYILAVIAEEYGALACLGLLAVFGFVLARAAGHIWRQEHAEVRLAVAGLSLLLVGQALVHLGVNCGLLPTKGMTLPFISYGGSSLLGTCLAAGMLLALTRGRRTVQYERPALVFQALPAA